MLLIEGTYKKENDYIHLRREEKSGITPSVVVVINNKDSLRLFDTGEIWIDGKIIGRWKGGKE